MQFIQLDADDALVQFTNDLLAVIVEEATDQYRDRAILGIGVDFFVAGDIGNAHRAF
ncbi:hypothetical protein D3C80_2212940 [compost metagenome]